MRAGAIVKKVYAFMDYKHLIYLVVIVFCDNAIGASFSGLPAAPASACAPSNCLSEYTKLCESATKQSVSACEGPYATKVSCELKRADIRKYCGCEKRCQKSFYCTKWDSEGNCYDGIFR